MKSGATTPVPGLDVRRLAAECFDRVLREQRTIEDVLACERRVAALEARDRGLLFTLLLTCFRHLGEIDLVLAAHLERPLPRKSGQAQAILRIAVGQLLFLGMAPHAVIDLAVRSAKADRNATHFSGLVNAVLRNVAAAGKAALLGIDSNRVNTPAWLWSRWSKTYGELATREFSAIHQQEPPLDLSVRSAPAEWAGTLGAMLLPTGSLRLAADHLPVSDLPGFGEGAWWVQDAAAAIPAHLLGSVQGKSVLDLCAAPGGKTLQFCAAGAEVTALDQSAERLQRLRDNLQRCGFDATVLATDIFDYTPEQRFDAVLLDAPCSATGTIRRHPELPYIKSSRQLGELRSLQSKMLRKASDFVRPGGTLVYCTCSLEPEEGEAQVNRFLKSNPEFSLRAPAAGLLPEEFVAGEGWVRILPHFCLGAVQGLDGFFAAALARHS